MKIYKLDIDTSKPIRQVVQMQQNSEGVLSVNMSNDGKYIRNLSCAVYEGGNEISAIEEGDNSFGYRIDIGGDPKIVKVTANSKPYESVIEGVASQSGQGTKQIEVARCQIKAGVYNQDEFLPLLTKVGGVVQTIWYVCSAQALSNLVNFRQIVFVPNNPHQQIWFRRADNTYLPYDEKISATEEVSCVTSMMVKRTTTLSSETYRSIGYYTDYALDTVIKPSMNAPCYAERDIEEPTPETPDLSSDDLSSIPE